MSDRAITGRVCFLGKKLGLDGLSAHDCRHFWAPPRRATAPIHSRCKKRWLVLAGHAGGVISMTTKLPMMGSNWSKKDLACFFFDQF